MTKEYSTCDYTFSVVNKGSWCLLSIVRKWKNDNDITDTFEEPLLTFSKYFDDYADAEAYTWSKVYKQIFKATVSAFTKEQKQKK